ESFELAQITHGAFHEQLTESYERAHDELRDTLAGNNQQFQDMRHAELSGKNNAAFLVEFAEMLPSGDFHSGVSANDPVQAKKIQSNTLWIREPVRHNSKDSTLNPYYIVGAHTATEERFIGKSTTATHLLALSAGYGRKLQVVTVRDDEFAVAREQAQVATRQEYDPQELERMFDPKSLKLKVLGRSGNNASVRTQMIDEKKLDLSRYRFRDIGKVVAEKGIQIRLDRDLEKKISDEDMGNFEVFPAVNNLALTFGKTDALKALLIRCEKEAKNGFPNADLRRSF
ncbi:MAG: hypothetical protein ABWX94_03580, partial [Candidatus Saccharimonadales bacterium]